MSTQRTPIISASLPTRGSSQIPKSISSGPTGRLRHESTARQRWQAARRRDSYQRDACRETGSLERPSQRSRKLGMPFFTDTPMDRAVAKTDLRNGDAQIGKRVFTARSASVVTTHRTHGRNRTSESICPATQLRCSRDDVCTSGYSSRRATKGSTRVARCAGM
jgi:hypothetical protein